MNGPFVEKTLDDGTVVQVPRDVITIRGQYLRWKVNGKYFPPPVVTTRNPITEFSKASRLRVLCIMASLDWQRCYPATYLSLTYPDLDEFPDKDTRNSHRWVFWRYVEKYLGKETCCLWRVEYVRRETGRWIGELFPHFHLMVFAVKYIPWQLVRKAWGAALGWEGPLVTHIRRIRNERQAGYYTSKYTAKVAPTSLDIGAYLNKPDGRHWGVHRKELLPQHEERIAENPLQGRMTIARHAALNGREKMNKWGTESFKLLGPLAVIVAGIIFDGTFDDCIENL